MIRSDFAGDWVRYEDHVAAVRKYGTHLDSCVVIMRFHSDDGSKCDCGYRDIVGGDDGENACDWCGSEEHKSGKDCPVMWEGNV